MLVRLPGSCFSDICRRLHPPQQTSCSSAACSPDASFSAVIPSHRRGSCFVDVSVETGLHDSAFQLVVASCNGLSVAKISFFMGVRMTLTCGNTC